MEYQVRMNGDGTYQILKNGIDVPGAKVKNISFPGVPSPSLVGDVYHISGPASVTIELPSGEIVEGIRLEV